jgi:hypothetical protein
MKVEHIPPLHVFFDSSLLQQVFLTFTTHEIIDSFTPGDKRGPTVTPKNLRHAAL